MKETYLSRFASASLTLISFINTKRLLIFYRMLCSGDWEAIRYRLWLLMNRIDITSVDVADLGLLDERSNMHVPSGSPYLQAMLNSLGIQPEDRLIDIGCGKGGALIALAALPFREIAGVEISPELVKIAESNFRKLGLERIRLHCADAADFTELDAFSYVYLFNPFPWVVMRSVIQNLMDSLTRNPRRVTIIYHTPTCHADIIEDGRFVLVREQVNADKNIRINIYRNTLGG